MPPNSFHFIHFRSFRLLVALLLVLSLGAGQLLLAGHSHEDGSVLHEDCVQCIQHSAGYDLPPPQILSFHRGQAIPLPSALIDAIVSTFTFRQRARSPPYLFL